MAAFLAERTNSPASKAENPVIATRCAAFVDTPRAALKSELALARDQSGSHP
jgi:hypothetical protein